MKMRIPRGPAWNLANPLHRRKLRHREREKRTFPSTYRIIDAAIRGEPSRWKFDVSSPCPPFVVELYRCRVAAPKLRCCTGNRMCAKFVGSSCCCGRAWFENCSNSLTVARIGASLGCQFVVVNGGTRCDKATWSSAILDEQWEFYFVCGILSTFLLLLHCTLWIGGNLFVGAPILLCKFMFSFVRYSYFH